MGIWPEGTLKRKFRLRKSTDFKRVRRLGKSYAHPLVVLIAQPAEGESPRIAVAAGRSLGNAIERNRAKRRLREAIRPLIPGILPGWDLILLARRPSLAAHFSEIRQALTVLLHRAKVLKEATERPQ